MNRRSSRLLAVVASLSLFPFFPSAAEQAGTARALLWKAASETATVYLFGSIHVASESMYPLPEKVESAFDASDYLVVEVNVGPETQARAAELTLARGSYPPGESLSDHVSQPLLEQLVAYLTDAGLPLEAFDRLEPWVVSLSVGVLEIQKLGLDPELGIERHFLEKAGDTKPVLELESLEQQLELFDSCSAETQELLLKKTLLEIDEIGANMSTMIDVWTRGDTDALEELMFRSLAESPELEPVFDRIFGDRNVKMVEKIRGYLETDSTYFVVVGAGHLVGEDGIVALLEKSDVAVERK